MLIQAKENHETDRHRHFQVHFHFIAKKLWLREFKWTCLSLTFGKAKFWGKLKFSLEYI